MACGASHPLAVFVIGLFVYVNATIKPLQLDPQKVASVTQATPTAQFAGAVERGRQAVRTSLSEMNLPGLSVAVGAGGEIVWAEGFGWAEDLEPASLGGQATTMVGHDGEEFMGGSSSLMTFPERGLVVAVMTNTSLANLSTVATKIAEAFADQARSAPGK